MSITIPADLEERRLLSERINQSLQEPRLINQFKQPVGPSLPDWTPVQAPNVTVLRGQYVSLVPLDVEKHLDGLWELFGSVEDSYWTYLFSGPFKSKDEFKTALESPSDWYYLTIFDEASGKIAGYINLMNINKTNGTIEVGSVCFSSILQKNRRGTEVIWLLMQYCIETLGYRRFEWKCDANNLPSRRAAIRFGFSFEGLFRKHVVFRGRTRDTAWFSITDDEYQEIMVPAYTEYLAPGNFDANGVQIKSLPDCRQPYRVAFDEKWSTLKAAEETL